MRVTHQALSRTVGVHRDSVVAAQDIPEPVAAYAMAATMSAIASRPDAGWTSNSARAYFDAVARRRLLKTHSRSQAAARVIADTVMADLIDSGRSATEALDELSRGWRDMVPEVILEEYRVRLSA